MKRRILLTFVSVFLALISCCMLFGCVVKPYENSEEPEDPQDPIVFTVVLKNNTESALTAWADGTIGDKVVQVNLGEKIVLPKLVYDTQAESMQLNSDFYYVWTYHNKNGVLTEFDASKEFTYENLNVDTYEITIQAMVLKQWAGPI